MCLFSVITVCYNSEKTIEETMKSVLNQNTDNYEYIIIDGKSTDGTLQIISKYKSEFGNKLKIVSERDNGIYDAMNKGLELSKGSLVGFLNSDDYYEKGALDKLEQLYENEYEFIYGNTRLMYNFENGEIIKKSEAIDNITLNNLNDGMGFSHQSCFVKRDVFYRIGKFNTEFKVGADWDFTIRCKKANIKFKKYDLIISCFSKDGASSKSHIMERHKIRKNNNLYKIIDINLVKDMFNPANLIQNIFGEELFIKAREVYHHKFKKVVE